MFIAILVIFLIGYLAIALEHPLQIDKSATALVTGVLCWTVLITGKAVFFPELPAEEAIHTIGHSLEEHLSDIASILFFLLGAMTIVELIDAHQGFSVISDLIHTSKKTYLLWLVSWITFFLSSALDNLTTAIVMAALLRKLLHDKNDLWFFAGMVVIAANAGGAWSPIGDVTTIMLWIGGQVTAVNIIKAVFLPSVVCLLVPLGIATFMLKGNVAPASNTLQEEEAHEYVPEYQRKLVLILGIGALLSIPIFKTLTHLPPYMGILLALGLLWMFTEVLHRERILQQRNPLTVVEVLRRVDVPSVLFFLGILLAVACLQTAGHLGMMAQLLDEKVGNIYLINTAIGILSAIVDNVPLVAGAMGMYPLTTFPPDHYFWELLAFCAGTGGSMLIIGSAAGVAIMGILKIDFLWYLKRISLLALAGYLAGIGTYLLLTSGTT